MLCLHSVKRVRVRKLCTCGCACKAVCTYAVAVILSCLLHSVRLCHGLNGFVHMSEYICLCVSLTGMQQTELLCGWYFMCCVSWMGSFTLTWVNYSVYTHITAGHKSGHGYSFPADCVSKINTQSHYKAHKDLTVSVARGDDVCNSSRLWY